MKALAIYAVSVVMIVQLCSCTVVVPVTFSEKEYLTNVYEDVVGSKDALYLKANKWMIATFGDATSVIQHQDKEAGAIIGKYLMGGQISLGAYGTTRDDRVYAIIDIQVKENKARIMIKPQEKWAYVNSDWVTTPKLDKNWATSEMKQLSESFHVAMLKAESDF